MTNRNTYILLGIFATIILASLYFFIRDYVIWGFDIPIDSNIFADWGSFVSGIMATGAFTFTFITFINQKNANINKSEKDDKYRNIQEFESRFFKLVENLQFIVSQINITTPLVEIKEDDKVDYINNKINSILVTNNEEKIINRIYDNRPIFLKGRQAIHKILKDLLRELPITKWEDIWEDGISDDIKHKKRYDEFYDKYFFLLGHYFRFVYNIIKYVDNQEQFDYKTKKENYINLLQAQISTDEMGLIFYNAIFSEKAKIKSTGELKFHKLLEDYKFLENIDNNSILKEEHKYKYYPKTFKK